MKILMVLTSHDKLGNTGKKTGFWLEEFATPYFVFKDAGADIVLASPLGGQPPIDPKSDEPATQTESTRRFKADEKAVTLLANTLKLNEISAYDVDAIFYPGGHGPLWDLAENSTSITLIETLLAANKPVATVCHAPAVLRHVKSPNGNSVVKDKKVTGFSNSEEAAAGLTNVVPFLVQDMLTQNGGNYSKVADWQPHVLTDGFLITGQNPASSELTAYALLALLKAH